mgnify:CR=1 FL=1
MSFLRKGFLNATILLAGCCEFDYHNTHHYQSNELQIAAPPPLYQRVLRVVAGDLFDDDDDDFVMRMRKAAAIILALGSVAVLMYWSIWYAMVFPCQLTSQVGIVSTLTAYFVFITTPAFIYARDCWS